ncbi:MAG: glycosyltransferase family 4 protein [Acinetobacter haemolyticus]
MKKVCFFIGNLNNSGGTERVTSIIANELSKQNYEVHILSLYEGEKPFFELDSRIQIHSLYLRKISFKRNFIQTVWRIRKFVQFFKINNLIVVDSISCVFTVPALMGLKINHICWEHFNFNVNLGVKLRDLGRKLAAKYCNYVVTLTKRDKDLWEQGLKGIKAKIISIANPTPYENIDHIPNLQFKTVLAVGRLTYQKGFDLLIEAWAQVCTVNPGWKLRIVGSGEDEELLKSLARKLGIYEYIEFIPATKNIESHYKTSSFYCMSSRFEGLPMVLLEAQAYGLPIVSLDFDTGPSDIIVHGYNGFLGKDILGLVKYLNYLISLNDIIYFNLVFFAKNNNKKFFVNNIILEWNELLK